MEVLWGNLAAGCRTRAKTVGPAGKSGIAFSVIAQARYANGRWVEQ